MRESKEQNLKSFHFETKSGSIYDIHESGFTPEKAVVASAFRARRELGYKSIQHMVITYPISARPLLGKPFCAKVLDGIGSVPTLATTEVETFDVRQ